MPTPIQPAADLETAFRAATGTPSHRAPWTCYEAELRDSLSSLEKHLAELRGICVALTLENRALKQQLAALITDH
jgi:hypothetical protein